MPTAKFTMRAMFFFCLFVVFFSKKAIPPKFLTAKTMNI